MKNLLCVFMFFGVWQVVMAQNDCWKDVAVGANHTIAIGLDGKLYGWGTNGDEQLGLGTSGPSVSPLVLISGSTDWKQVSASKSNSFAIKNDGSMWSWGAGSWGGALGYNAEWQFTSWGETA